MLEASFVISASHPSLPGHFPNHPIAPGVVALDYIAHRLIERIPESCLVGFPNVKFARPLLPGMEVRIKYVDKGNQLFQFKCESNGNLVLFGQVQLAWLKD